LGPIIPRIARLAAENWGLFHTATLNLEKIARDLPQLVKPWRPTRALASLSGSPSSPVGCGQSPSRSPGASA
jgi:hypothetical protein